jgi:hypothetical protein
MKKQIESSVLKDIANRFALFNLGMPMNITVQIGKIIIKTIDEYSEDEKVTYDFVDLKQLYNSDYYRDYDESLYKDKKPPFVARILQNLINDPELMLQQHYAEKVVEEIMKAASLQAKFDINAVMEAKFDIYSGELLVTNHMDLPHEFGEIFREILNEFNGTINTIEGSANFTEHVASKYNFGFFTTNQSSIHAFPKNGEIMFGEIDYENFNEDEVKEKYKNKPNIGDENSLILIDRYQMVDLIGKMVGKPKAREIVANYIKEMPWILHEVKSSKYIVKFTPDIQQLKTVEKYEDYPEINPLFILRTESLENSLKQNSSSKLKI